MDYTPNHNNLYLSIGSFCVSIVTGMSHMITQSNTLFFISACSGIIAAFAGYLVIKERKANARLNKLNIEIAEAQLKAIHSKNRANNAITDKKK